MAAMTVRNLPDEVHGGLRRLAEARQMSVESLVRVALAEMVRREGDAPGPAQASGFGEAAMPWGALVPGDPDHSVGPEAAPGELWGALKGSVHVAPDTDLTAPLAERWRAED